MAEETNTPVAAPAAVVAPVTNTPDRLSVPASAIFNDDERTLNVTAPAAPAAKPAEAPAAPAAPAAKPAEAPAAPAKPAEAPAAPAAPAKVKIGGKEYTQEELEKALAERSAPAPVAPAKPAEAPVAPEAKPPTAEEITAKENTWTQEFIKNNGLNFAPTEDEVETLLTGGKEAATLLATKFNDICAKAVLLARKSIYADMNPVLSEISSKVQPVYANAQQVEVAAAEQQFLTTYNEFKPHIDTVRQVATALLTQFPQECAKLSREQLMAEVAAQSDRILQADFKRWNPAATGTWRETGKAPAASAATPPAVPAAAPAARPAAPGANSPAAVPAGGAPANWHKDTAKSLAD